MGLQSFLKNVFVNETFQMDKINLSVVKMASLNGDKNKKRPKKTSDISKLKLNAWLLCLKDTKYT